MSHFTIFRSHVTCHLSPTPTATATDPPCIVYAHSGGSKTETNSQPKKYSKLTKIKISPKSYIWETLNLSTCADSSTNTKKKHVSFVTCLVAHVMCHVQRVICHISCVSYQMSPVTCHLSLTLTATATDPPLVPLCTVN